MEKAEESVKLKTEKQKSSNLKIRGGKKDLKNEQGLSDLENNIKRSNMYNWSPRRTGENGEEKLFEEIITKKFSIFGEIIKT